MPDLDDNFILDMMNDGATPEEIAANNAANGVGEKSAEEIAAEEAAAKEEAGNTKSPEEIAAEEQAADLAGKKPVEQASTESQEFDFVSHFGEGATLENVTDVFKRGQSYTPEVAEELTILRAGAKEVTQLRADVKELRGRQPFTDEKLFKLDQISTKDPENASFYKKYMFGEMSDENLVKMKFTMENPDILKGNPDYINRKFDKDFAALSDPELEPGDPTYDDAKTDLALQAKAIRTEFDKKISEVEIPEMTVPKTAEEIEADTAKFIEGWKPSFDTVKEALQKIDIPVLSEDGKKQEVFMSYEIPEAEKADVHKMAASFIIESRLEATEENVKFAINVAKANYISEKLPVIATSILNEGAKNNGDAWLKKFSNASKEGADAKHTHTNKKDDGTFDEEAYLEN